MTVYGGEEKIVLRYQLLGKEQSEGGGSVGGRQIARTWYFGGETYRLDDKQQYNECER
jgi:hypothetical protein